MVEFEVLCIDQQGKVAFSNESRFVNAISCNEKLCGSPLEKIEEGLEFVENGGNYEDRDYKNKWQFQSLDTSKVIGDLFTSAFIIKVEGNEARIGSLRENLLKHLSRLGFKHIRILKDELSQNIAEQIYPLLNDLENLLRRYIVKFFLTRIGLNWFDVVASQKPKEKKKIREKNQKIFSAYINPDVELIDFDELGEIIYQQQTAFSKTEEIIKNIENAKSLEELRNSIQGNYAKYFKDYFGQQFESKWKRCFEIRNKVAHNYIFVEKDLQDACKLIQELKEIIDNADKKIDEAVFSIAEKEAVNNAIEGNYSNNEDEQEVSDEEEILNNGSSKHYSGKTETKKISEQELLEELAKTEEEYKKQGKDFVGLGVFVKQILSKQGYSPTSSYVVINILKDREKLEIYEIENPFGKIPTKGIKIRQ